MGNKNFNKKKMCLAVQKEKARVCQVKIKERWSFRFVFLGLHWWQIPWHPTPFARFAANSRSWWNKAGVWEMENEDKLG